MDIGQKLKGIQDIFVKPDTWINFTDIWIKSFLNFGDIYHIYFWDIFQNN